VADLKNAIAAEDVKRLSGLPGIGKKTAERLVLELKDKVGPVNVNLSETSVSSLPGKSSADLINDVISALVNLGYKENQVRKVLESMELAPDVPMEDALKGALKVLVR
jgi:Holliday junction DNA helicase RuvA